MPPHGGTTGQDRLARTESRNSGLLRPPPSHIQRIERRYGMLKISLAMSTQSVAEPNF